MIKYYNFGGTMLMLCILNKVRIAVKCQCVKWPMWENFTLYHQFCVGVSYIKFHKLVGW
jgi:hypothetical protein